MTADISAACVPPKGTADGSWHWLYNFKLDKFDPAQWRPNRRWARATSMIVDTPGEAKRAGWRYVCPIPSPDELAAMRGELVKLTDPNAVHLSMLAGTIARPSLAQIAHLYPEVRELVEAGRKMTRAATYGDVESAMIRLTAALAAFKEHTND